MSRQGKVMHCLKNNSGTRAQRTMEPLAKSSAIAWTNETRVSSATFLIIDDQLNQLVYCEQ